MAAAGGYMDMWCEAGFVEDVDITWLVGCVSKSAQRAARSQVSSDELCI